MPNPIAISIVESILFPDCSDLYLRKNITELRVNSIRKALTLIKKNPIDFIVVEFFYAYSTIIVASINLLGSTAGKFN